MSVQTALTCEIRLSLFCSVPFWICLPFCVMYDCRSGVCQLWYGETT